MHNNFHTTESPVSQGDSQSGDEDDYSPFFSVENDVLSIEHTINDARWIQFDTAALMNIATHILANTEWTRPCCISLVFTDDKEVQALNASYRQKDQATNVLSFPGYDDDLLTILPLEQPVPLGDIVLSFDTIEKEAIAQNKPFQHHAIHLFVHGMLHLLGFDHLEDAEAEQMECLETKILQHFFIPNPYEAS